jgi:hypothetical protein
MRTGLRSVKQARDDQIVQRDLGEAIRRSIASVIYDPLPEPMMLLWVKLAVAQLRRVGAAGG